MSIKCTVQGDKHKNTVVIGGYYRRPKQGDIVYTYGGGGNAVPLVSWRTEHKHGQATREEMDTWEYLPYLRDFPNAEDPQLPYEFDLVWDVHTLSQLISEYNSFEDCLEDPDVRIMCNNYGIDLRNPQTIRDYNTRYAEESSKSKNTKKSKRNGSR